jgi:hypothetical protein
MFAATSQGVRKVPRRYKAAYLDSDTSTWRASAQSRNLELAGDLWSLTQSLVDKILAGKFRGFFHKK